MLKRNSRGKKFQVELTPAKTRPVRTTKHYSTVLAKSKNGFTEDAILKVTFCLQEYLSCSFKIIQQPSTGHYQLCLFLLLYRHSSTCQWSEREMVYLHLLRYLLGFLLIENENMAGRNRIGSLNICCFSSEFLTFSTCVFSHWLFLVIWNSTNIIFHWNLMKSAEPPLFIAYSYSILSWILIPFSSTVKRLCHKHSV